MKLDELNPHIRYARKQHTSLANKNNIHICYDARLFFFENATGSVKIGKTKYNISNNTAIYLPPLSRYSFDIIFDKNTSAYTFDFDLISDYSYISHSLGTASIDSFDSDRSPSYEVCEEFIEPIIKEIGEIKSQLSQCILAFIDKRPFYREKASALLKLCLIELLYRSSEHRRSELCEKILTFVHEEYSDSFLTNESIASRLNYHPYHINRVVKKEVGKPLRAYIISYRLGAAKNLLLTTTASISHIAEACGFASTAYFIKLFKEKNGMTPSEYRRSRIHTEI